MAFGMIVSQIADGVCGCDASDMRQIVAWITVNPQNKVLWETKKLNPKSTPRRDTLLD